MLFLRAVVYYVGFRNRPTKKKKKKKKKKLERFRVCAASLSVTLGLTPFKFYAITKKDCGTRRHFVVVHF
jgi:hypothetical protein